jgi:hypothetical protein
MLVQLAECVERLVPRLVARFGESLYFFEHGVEPGGTACGVDHAHLHVLPLDPDKAAAVDVTVNVDYPASSSGSMFYVLAAASGSAAPSYLLRGRSLTDLRITFAESIPSQYMRRTVSKALGQNEWDWRSLNRKREFLETRAVLV